MLASSAKTNWAGAPRSGSIAYTSILNEPNSPIPNVTSTLTSPIALSAGQPDANTSASFGQSTGTASALPTKPGGRSVITLLTGSTAWNWPDGFLNVNGEKLSDASNGCPPAWV